MMSIQEQWYHKSRNGGLGYQYPMRGYGFYGGMITDKPKSKQEIDLDEMRNYVKEGYNFLSSIGKVSKPKASIQQQSLLPDPTIITADNTDMNTGVETKNTGDETIILKGNEVIATNPDVSNTNSDVLNSNTNPDVLNDLKQLSKQQLDKLEKEITEEIRLKTAHIKTNYITPIGKTVYDDVKPEMKLPDFKKSEDGKRRIEVALNNNNDYKKLNGELNTKQAELDLIIEAKAWVKDVLPSLQNKLDEKQKELVKLNKQKTELETKIPTLKSAVPIANNRALLVEIKKDIEAKKAEIKELQSGGKVDIVKPYFMTERNEQIERYNDIDNIQLDTQDEELLNIYDTANIHNSINTVLNTIDTEPFKPPGFTNSDINTYIHSISDYIKTQHQIVLNNISTLDAYKQLIGEAKYNSNPTAYNKIYNDAKEYFKPEYVLIGGEENVNTNKGKPFSVKLSGKDGFEDSEQYSDDTIKTFLKKSDPSFNTDNIDRIYKLNTNYTYNKNYERVPESSIIIDKLKAGYSFELNIPKSAIDKTKADKTKVVKDDIDVSKYLWYGDRDAPYDNVIIVKYKDGSEVKYTIENKYYDDTHTSYLGTGNLSNNITYKDIIDDTKDLYTKYTKYNIAKYANALDLNKKGTNIDEVNKYKTLIDMYKNKPSEYLEEFYKHNHPIGFNIKNSKFPRPGSLLREKKLNPSTKIASNKSITPESYYDYITKHEASQHYATVVLDDSNSKYGYIKGIKTKLDREPDKSIFDNSKLLFIVSYSDAVKFMNWTNITKSYQHKNEHMIRNAFEVRKPGKAAYGAKSGTKHVESDSVVLRPFDTIKWNSNIINQNTVNGITNV